MEHGPPGEKLVLPFYKAAQLNRAQFVQWIEAIPYGSLGVQGTLLDATAKSRSKTSTRQRLRALLRAQCVGGLIVEPAT